MTQETPNNDLIASACRRRHWTYRYREFLLDPGTIFTFASGLLLMLAILRDPGAFFSSGGSDRSDSLFYLAAALVGSSFIWWSALQGIREHGRGCHTASVKELPLVKRRASAPSVASGCRVGMSP